MTPGDMPKKGPRLVMQGRWSIEADRWVRDQPKIMPLRKPNYSVGHALREYAARVVG